MSKVELIVQPRRLAQIKTALSHAGVDGMTVSSVWGVGRRASSNSEGLPDERPGLHLKVEIVLETPRVPSLVYEILRSSRTPVGDGMVFVHDLDDAIRIRTQEHGYDAV